MIGELKKKEFSKGLKGYNTAEVDEYLDYVLAKYAEARSAYAELNAKYQAALVKLEEAKSEEATFSAIVVDARKMADAIIKDANEKAKAVSEAVNESCDKILETYRKNVAAERDKLYKAEQLATEFKSSLYAAYREHIDAIDRILPDESEDTESISTATDEELLDSALELAKEKYNTGADDIDLPPMYNTKEDDTAE